MLQNLETFIDKVFGVRESDTADQYSTRQLMALAESSEDPNTKVWAAKELARRAKNQAVEK